MIDQTAAKVRRSKWRITGITAKLERHAIEFVCAHFFAWFERSNLIVFRGCHMSSDISISFWTRSQEWVCLLRNMEIKCFIVIYWNFIDKKVKDIVFIYLWRNGKNSVRMGLQENFHHLSYNDWKKEHQSINHRNNRRTQKINIWGHLYTLLRIRWKLQ